MTEPQSWATHTLQLIRETLTPLMDEAGRLARGLGGDPDVQVDKAHYTGQAQGISDAMRALEQRFGAIPRVSPERLELADVPPAEYPVVHPIASTTRNAHSSAFRWTPQPGHLRSEP